MRIDKFIPNGAGGRDPVTKKSQESFLSGHLHTQPGQDYDLYLVGGNVYICRDGCVTITTSSGAIFVSGDEGKKICERYAKQFPRPSLDVK